MAREIEGLKMVFRNIFSFAMFGGLLIAMTQLPCLASGKDTLADPNPQHKPLVQGLVGYFDSLPDDLLFALMQQMSDKDLKCGLELTCKYFQLKFRQKLPELEFVYESKMLNPQYINLAIDDGYIPGALRLIGCTWTDVEGATVGAGIKSLPSAIISGTMAGFKYMFSSKNPTPTIGQKSAALTTLQTLQIKGTYPKDFTKTVVKYTISPVFLERLPEFTNLKSADFHNVLLDEMKLKMLPSALQMMSSLTDLSFHNTKLEKCPAFFDNLMLLSLTKLNLCFAEVQDSHFKGIARFTNLIWLDLFHNFRFGQNPINGQLFSSLKNLASLHISSCCVSDLTFIKNLTALENLDLKNNPFSDPRSEMVVRLITALKPLTKLHSLAILNPTKLVSEEEIKALQIALPSLQEVYSDK